ncbi:glycogen debranching protein [Sulfolobus sp. S-194]|uniref:amylo-alpha-1,6-glucosidase n=1 Tax=Sulfolobus sp. S-194 TaxID=2512240 RepID=UPI001436E77E|nr:amylo-alpha-1,6-glucosidase [Sulfolobus sp. S-194]QIW23673.1 glycogen debranching protein [Sulfolobus sp. S-194]
MIDPEECEYHEWILPFKTGGYASSTICGINSRTYHGFLIVPLNQPHKRYLVLSKFEDFMMIDNEEYPINTNRYFDVYYPEGYKYLENFKWEKNYVKWVYEYGKVTLEKVLIAHEYENAVTISYKADKGELKICPLITFRSHHLVTEKGTYFDSVIEGNKIEILKDNMPILHFYIESTKTRIELTGYWYYNFFYRLDYERGSNYKEDLFNPFCIYTSNEATITVYYDKSTNVNAENSPSDLLRLLSMSSRDFVVKGKTGWSIIAGYHWFDEWGRDTFISMEGLLLLNRFFDQAKDIILRYLDYENKGLLPNHITANGEPIYVGVDVSLWAINSIYSYYLYSKDKEFIRKIYPKLQDIVENYAKGNGVVYIKEGLLFHRGAPRTWMDASYDSHVVTPREGAAVEINALWYNALMIMDFFTNIVEDKNSMYKELAEKTKASFNEKFVSSWGAYDYLDPYLIPDKSIRPNQLFALSLPFNIMSEDIGKIMLTTIENELLRPFGLSTLSRRDPKYKPTYRGDRKSRDEAYHNGPIWPWLIGAYVDAKLKIESDVIKNKLILDVVKPLLEYAKKNRGFIPELYEDVPPYLPAGCIAQAWSVAEVYRAINKLLSL